VIFTVEIVMPLNVRNEVNRLTERLAAIKRMTKTHAVFRGLKEELRRTVFAPLLEQIIVLQDRILAYPPTGREADQGFSIP
jgi:hypothetical protein